MRDILHREPDDRHGGTRPPLSPTPRPARTRPGLGRAAAVVSVIVLATVAAAALPARLAGRRGASSGTDRDRDPARAAAERAARWLWSKQAEDGGWHSETYGILRSGQSLTPFVLLHLLEAADAGVCAAPRAPVDRAIAFILAHTDGFGAVGRMDPIVEDYPSYATSLAVRAIVRARRPGFERAIAPMVECLRRQQFREDRGWTRDHPAYGAWGMGGPLRTLPYAGHVDLSMTRHVLEALADAGVPRDDPVFERALVFLGRLQNPDGGFFFSTVVLDANKAGPSGVGRYRSYGSTTADGVLALLAAGVAPDDPRVEAAMGWLRRHHRTDRVPGIPAEVVLRWDDGVRTYYLAAAARVIARLGEGPTPPGIAAAVAALQRPDGSFKNGNALMKEDDPLIATTLALAALLASR